MRTLTNPFAGASRIPIVATIAQVQLHPNLSSQDSGLSGGHADPPECATATMGMRYDKQLRPEHGKSEASARLEVLPDD